jgi:hypothetical protein
MYIELGPNWRSVVIQVTAWVETWTGVDHVGVTVPEAWPPRNTNIPAGIASAQTIKTQIDLLIASLPKTLELIKTLQRLY